MTTYQIYKIYKYILANKNEVKVLQRLGYELKEVQKNE